LLSFVITYGELLGACLEGEQQYLVREATVPLSRLRGLGIADPTLLWMMYQGHVEHLQPDQDEILPGCKPIASLQFTSTSCFALTASGMDFAHGFLAGVLLPDDDDAFAELWDSLLLGCLLPGYDKENRLLLWGRQVLKSFRQPAENQEIILCSAEETIKALNRNQQHGLVHFRGDGTGTRVGWVYR
jgi:hypothetical protein